MLFEHIQRRHILRRRHRHRAGQADILERLRQRQRDIAGARRHVDDQVIERRPVNLVEKLAQ